MDTVYKTKTTNTTVSLDVVTVTTEFVMNVPVN